MRTERLNDSAAEPPPAGTRTFGAAAVLVLVSVLSGCVTTRPSTALSFDDSSLPREAAAAAAPVPELPASPPPVAPAPPEAKDGALAGEGTEAPKEPPVERVAPAPSDPELAAALLRFNTRARKERAGVKRGSALPRSQEENWEGLLESLDVFLGRPAAQMEKLDVIRARVTLEAQLARDARLFGDFPAPLAEAVMERLTVMAVRLSDLKRHEASAKTQAEKQRFAWPVDPVHITSVFGRRRHPITRKVKPHRGVDLDAKRGQPIFSAAGGVVVKAGRNGAHGLQVMVEHASGLQTRYSHLSEILVDVGMRLEEGEVLGLAGRTGRVTGVHLHFEVWRGKRALDPLEFMRELPPAPNAVNTRS